MFATWLRLAVRAAHVGEAAEKGSAAVILRIVREHGPCNKNVIWQHAEEAGVKSKRHMKLMLRWLMEKNQVRIKCLTNDPSAPQQQQQHGMAQAGASGLPGSAAAAAAASRGAGTGAFAAAGAARVQPAGVKKRGKHVTLEKEFLYTVAPRYVPRSSQD